MCVVEDYWKGAKVNFVKMCESQDFCILGDNEEPIQKLDATLLKASNILASKYCAPVRQRAEKQVLLLKYSQRLLDEWILHQKQWLYLDPIFNSSFA